VVDDPQSISAAQVHGGDAIILSGDMGRHGIAVMASRDVIGFETSVFNDSASVVQLVLEL